MSDSALATRTVSRAEQRRLDELADYQILDTAPEQAFDDITLLASTVCMAPMAMVTLVDAEREWFKSKIGIGAAQLPRYLSFCAQAIKTPRQLTIVPDATVDPRFAENGLVQGPLGVRFYAGAPLVTNSGLALGTVCVLDSLPRQLTSTQTESLRALSRQVIAQLELRRLVNDLRHNGDRLQRTQAVIERKQLELAEVNAQLRNESLTDPLTGIANRRAFELSVGSAIALAESRSEPLSLILFDIDHFKAVNDTRGHQKGDEVLHDVANILKDTGRKGDLLARYGGEEFAVVCPGTNEAQARGIAERLCSAIRQHHFDGLQVTLSAGIASLSVDNLNADELMMAADQALYQAKHDGRDRTFAFSHLRDHRQQRSG